MERYLVTGGAGFIGSHLALTLAEAGQPVRVFDDFSSGRAANLASASVAASARLEIVRGDLRDAEAVRAAAAGVDVIFHEGAIASVPRSLVEPATTLDVNVKGLLHVLEAARQTGVRRIVIASSSAIYGDTATLPLREDLPPRPLSPYAAHKLADEQLCAVYARLYGLETVALRYFNVYGPRQDPHSEYAAVIPRFVAKLRAGERPIVYGDGEQTRD
ncbi:MAG TPA: SDR family NAD(P)-dependent oxidoreductase, partial [Ktedonobacterales bacterium]